MYDYLVVGAGLYGAVFAHEAKKAGKKVLVIDRRPNIAGNVYTEPMEGIQVHKYGAHIFHTSDKQVWNYVNKLTEFNNYINSPVAVYKDELYNLPFNMNTFSRLWNLRTPKEVQAKIQEQIADFVTSNSRISREDFEHYMMATGEIATDVGTILYGKEAVASGLIDKLGGLNDALSTLHRMIEKQKK